RLGHAGSSWSNCHTRAISTAPSFLPASNGGLALAVRGGLLRARGMTSSSWKSVPGGSLRLRPKRASPFLSPRKSMGLNQKPKIVSEACISKRNYTASVPRDYIVLNKHNYVTRIVPTFSYRDACVYFFCIKRLEEYIAGNRVEGTFGGWQLGNSIRKKEDEESAGMYVPTTSYNRFQYSKHWRDYQKLAYKYSWLGEFNYFLKFDIANFYDTINLRLLENKIRL